MSNNIVFIVNLPESKKVGRNVPYRYSLNSWKEWCKKHKHTLYVLSERIHPEEYMNANWHKIFALDLLDSSQIDYDQVLIVDADTLIHPSAPDLFTLTHHQFAAVHNYGSYDWVCRSIENYKKFFFPDIDLKPFEYFNSGVIICNRKHKTFYNKVQKFYTDNAQNLRQMQNTYGVGTDQPVLNFMIQQENVDYKKLPYEWNMQDLRRFEILDDNLTFTKVGWLYHFNSISDDIRNYYMQKTYTTLNKTL